MREWSEVMYKIVFFVPGTHLERVKEALFAKGAGRFRNYDRCAWQTEGQGQFRPLPESRPFLGSEGETERVAEFRVEMICPDGILREVLGELVRVHPYEEPAYEACRIFSLDDLPPAPV